MPKAEGFLQRNKAFVILCAIILVPLTLMVVAAQVQDTIDAAGLRPLAQRLEIQPTRSALWIFVEKVVEEHKGESPDQVHRVMRSYLDPGLDIQSDPLKVGDPWVERETWSAPSFEPLGLRVTLSWSMFYDKQDRLIRVEVNE